LGGVAANVKGTAGWAADPKWPQGQARPRNGINPEKEPTPATSGAISRHRIRKPAVEPHGGHPKYLV